MTNSHSLDLALSSSQYASITDANQTGLDLTGDFTIEAWVNVESALSSGDFRGIISKYNNAAGQRAYRLAYRNNSGTLQIELITRDSGDSLTNIQLWNQTLTVGEWTHIAVTYDVSEAASTEGELFINGSSVGNPDSSGSNISAVQNSPTQFLLGALEVSGSATLYWDGLIDEIRVWSDIRTSGEISANYTQIIDPDSANLVGYWKLNNDYLDETSNDNDLTASGSPVFSTDVPFVGTTLQDIIQMGIIPFPR